MFTLHLFADLQKKKRSVYYSYYNNYYGDHVENEKSKPEAAEEDQSAGFVDITQAEKVTVFSPFKTDTVEALEFQGKIFVLTGFGAADEEKITKMITDKGGEVKSSVVLKTDYLVVNEDYDHATSKYTKALELREKGKNILVIGAKRFYELA